MIKYLIIAGIISGVIALMYWLAYKDGYRTGYRRACKDHDILTGEDADRFMEAMNNPVKLSPEQVEKIKASYELLKTRSDIDRERDEEEFNMNKPIFENEEAANTYHFEIAVSSEDRWKQVKIYTKVAKVKGFIKSELENNKESLTKNPLRNSD